MKKIKRRKQRIKKYGFNYSTKDIVLESISIISSVLFISYISKLQGKYMLGLLGLTILLAPFIIFAWMKQTYNIEKFTILTDYLGNIIPIFTQKAKIRYTLGELYEITNGLMKETIGKAIKYMDNTVDDPDLNKNALKIIEEEFPNSRVKSTHKLLLSIETSNSVMYEGVCQNMYEDIEKWIKRVYTFEKDLKNRRNKLLILCVATLLMNSLFVYLYVSNDYFVGFTDMPIYQISTFIFIATILITITIILTKLHGEWLVNDTDFRKDEYIKKQYILYKNGIPKIKIINLLSFLICTAGGVFVYIKGSVLSFVLCMMCGGILLLNPLIRHRVAYRDVNKALTIEFPVWLREISLTLNNLTVLNAIERSLSVVSYPMKKEIKKFLDEAKQDPTSIKAYNDFLSDFDLEDAKSSMKVLYAIQNIGKDDVKARVSNLISRNQEMLDRSETLRNNDSISGIEAIGFIPTAVFSIQMMVSMFAMFGYMMSTISGAIKL